MLKDSRTVSVGVFGGADSINGTIRGNFYLKPFKYVRGVVRNQLNPKPQEVSTGYTNAAPVAKGIIPSG